MEILKIVLHQNLRAIGVILLCIHVLAGAVEIFSCQFAARGQRIEDITEDVLPLTILVIGEVAVLVLDANHRIAAGECHAARQIDLGCSLPSPHRHGLNLLGIGRIGGEVETGTFQILNVGRDAFAVDTVHEEPEPRENLDATAELRTPTEQRGVVAGAYVVGIEITEYGRCTQVAFAVATPRYLQIDGEVRHALRQRSEKVVVGGADVGHFGCKTECHVVAREGYFVADHRRELEIVGVGALEVDGRRSRHQVAERRDVAADRETFERNVGRTQTRNIAALRTTAEVTVDVNYDTAQSAGVGDGFQEDTRGRGIHRQLLTGGVIPGDGDVVRNEIEIVDGSLEFIGRTQRDVAAQCEREFVVLACEDELREFRLLEARTMGLQIVLRRTFHGQPIECCHLSSGAYIGIDRIHFVHGDQIDRRHVFAVSCGPHAMLGRSGSGH